MFTAKDVDFDEIEEGEPLREASSDGYGFAKSGGVADAVAKYIKKVAPDREVKVVKAEGLENCRKMLKDALKGKYDGYLLEGMACPGGCIGGAGTLIPRKRAEYQLSVSQKEANITNAIDTQYADWLPTVENLDKEFAEFTKEDN